MLNQVQTSLAPPTSVPELGHLKAAAERLSQINYNLMSFHSRFFGPRIPDGSAGAQGEPVPCYRNDISAVFDQIGQIENLVSDLQNIG